VGKESPSSVFKADYLHQQSSSKNFEDELIRQVIDSQPSKYKLQNLQPEVFQSPMSPSL
jgi:hypothetical protein